MSFRLVALTALLAATALAKTDLEGCTYYDAVTSYEGRDDIPAFATRVWYVEDTREICEFLDCGGGRAPPKTNVPGCGNYKGTETYSPRFLPSETSSAAQETTPAATGTDDAPATTAAPTKSGSGAGEDEEEASASGTPDGDDDGEQETPMTPGSAPTETEGAGGAGDEAGNETDDVPGSGAASMGVSVMGGLLVAGVAAALF